MTDLQWLSLQMEKTPSEDELDFFVERIEIIVDGYTLYNEILEKARKQAFEELKAHDF